MSCSNTWIYFERRSFSGTKRNFVKRSCELIELNVAIAILNECSPCVNSHDIKILPQSPTLTCRRLHGEFSRYWSLDKAISITELLSPGTHASTRSPPLNQSFRSSLVGNVKTPYLLRPVKRVVVQSLPVLLGTSANSAKLTSLSSSNSL